MNKGYYIDGKVLVINRDLTDLDLFLKDFLEVLKKHSDYLIVSGYVSISTGRTRATEDIDVLVPIMEEKMFSSFLKDIEGKFWCYQGDIIKEIYSYLKKYTSLRFSRINETFPNIEFIPIDKNRKAKWFEFTHPQKIRVKNFEFKIPPIEFEILYKEKVLKSDKDKKDALHLRTFFSEILDDKRFKEYELIISQEQK